MIRKIFSIITISAIVCFSFYYTHLATVVVKNNDPIMKKIINVSKTYTQKPINATFSNNSIMGQTLLTQVCMSLFLLGNVKSKKTKWASNFAKSIILCIFATTIIVHIMK